MPFHRARCRRTDRVTLADPGIVRTNGNFYAFTTGSLAPLFVGDEAGGPWSAAGHALASAGAWATSNAIWAPDAVQTSAGWVLYYWVDTPGSTA